MCAAARPSRHPLAVAAALALLLALGAVLLVAARQRLEGPTGAAVAQVRVDEGMSTRAIGRRLEAAGLIRSATYFEALARLRGVAGRLEAGNYRLDGGRTTGQLLDDLLEAPLEMVRVTIPEGLTRQEIAQLLQRQGIADSARFLAATQDPALIAAAGIAAPSLEGYLFPETYLWPPDIGEADIVRHLVQQFFTVFTDDDFERLRVVGLSLHQAVTLASIVEGEAVAASERPLIAAIFLRRLSLSRRLESCATIEYALGVHKKRLTNEDLKVPSPYNTYRHAGLPPGPIGNPGAASLEATLHPVQDTEYLYFVARGDGTHQFSRTNREHEAAKRAIRRQARAATAAAASSGLN